MTLNTHQFANHENKKPEQKMQTMAQKENKKE